MRFKKPAEFYTDEELKEMKQCWLIEKAQIDANPVFGYYRDKDREYERYFSNANLRALFRHAAWLRNKLIENQQLLLYPKERSLINEVYEEMTKNGYYSRSKETEKKIRAWLGKTVSRQYRPKYK